MAFDAAERNRRFGRIQCKRGREQQQKKETSIPLQKNSESQIGKVIPASFLKIEGGRSLGQKTGERDR